MGIRISKQIGYFLSTDKINHLFVPNYEEIMEELDYNDDIRANFFKDFLSFSSTILDESEYDKIIFKLDIQQIQKNNIPLTSLISLIYFHDDFEGILFSTPSQAQSRRHDDNIDYYENPTYENKVNYLQRPIYPISGYVYHGGLEEHFDESRLMPGNTYMEHLSTYALVINEVFYNNEKDLDTDVTTLLTEKGFFTPRIDPFIYALAKRANLLKEEVNFNTFNKSIKPAIITSWA